ncbi:MAG TPA: SIS domain-containing protein [Acidimicrobiales bacterium]|nr:SIS domain-containing protein [Acidimicrobiales bacterium]
MTASVDDGLAAGLDSLQRTAAAIAALPERSADALRAAAQLVLDRNGALVVTGLGKSGLVGAKLAATFASTGTVSYFVHAADALHGDSGMVRPDDVLLALSYRGETAEVVAFARMAAARGVPVISVTGCGGASSLAALAAVTLDGCIEREGDPHDLAPTVSTSVALALGDALAITLMVARGFGPDDFKTFHPGGSLGRMLDGQ